MTTIKIPTTTPFSLGQLDELKQTFGILDIQVVDDHQLLISLENDDAAAIAQILNKINDLDKDLTLTLGSFPIEKLSCDGCASSAERLLNNQPGVVTASVKFQTKSAKIYYLQNKTTPLKLKIALEQLGYELAV